MRKPIELEEYRLLLGIAHELIDNDPAIADKDRTARRMVEAHFRGQLERERLTRERIERVAA
jgi:hypothetical protein